MCVCVTRVRSRVCSKIDTTRVSKTAREYALAAGAAVALADYGEKFTRNVEKWDGEKKKRNEIHENSAAAAAAASVAKGVIALSSRAGPRRRRLQKSDAFIFFFSLLA